MISVTLNNLHRDFCFVCDQEINHFENVNKTSLVFAQLGQGFCCISDRRDQHQTEYLEHPQVLSMVGMVSLGDKIVI